MIIFLYRFESFYKLMKLLRKFAKYAGLLRRGCLLKVQLFYLDYNLTSIELQVRYNFS